MTTEVWGIADTVKQHTQQYWKQQHDAVLLYGVLRDNNSMKSAPERGVPQ